MGIFDDAIREHLDLKRQHGADEPELRKLEDEAFGSPDLPAAEQDTEGAQPVASGPLEASTPVAEMSSAAPLPQDLIESLGEAPTELVDLEEQPTEDPLPLDEEHPAIEQRTVEPESESESESEAAAVADQPTELHELEEDETSGEIVEAEESEEEFFSEQSLSDELDQALDAPGGAPPAEEPEPAAQEGEETEPEDGEDVLEETPEFLQDTPEHDRLWFEQKPPKDFDFDE